ncbi:MAG: ABC transporter permease [Parachlamydiales bacterium]|jgi:putative ABC transport system permease protein
MLKIAIKMLIKDKAKYIGIILGLTFASFIITQQAAIFVGIMSRTYGFISDTSQGDIWVMDPKVQFIDDIKPLKDTVVNVIKGIDGVQWAVPLYKGLIKARLSNGNFQNCILIGIDDATLIGGPPIILQGTIQDLKLIDAIIVNKVGAEDKLAQKLPNGKKIPLKIFDVLELNDNRSQVVGICDVQRTFQSQPLIYTTYSKATSFAPFERKMLSFVLVKAKNGSNIKKVCQNIQKYTNYSAYTNEEFKKLTVDYYLKYTGIPLNFGIAVLLGFVIGAAIAGQTFYNFILDNQRYLAVFKAMGAQNNVLIKMTLLQVTWVGFIGWALGAGFASFFGFLMKNTDLSFKLPWELFLFTIGSIFFICLVATLLSLRKVMRVEPAIVFKT